MIANRFKCVLPAAVAAFCIGIVPSVVSAQVPAPAQSGAKAGKAGKGKKDETPAEKAVAHCVEHFEAHDLSSAKADCAEAIRLDPKFSIAWFDTGVVYYWLGDYETAIKNYDQANLLSPDIPSVLFARGAANYKLGKLPEAMEDYTKAIDLGTEDPTVYLDRGLVYYDMGVSHSKTEPAAAEKDWAAAEKDYTQAIRLNRDFTNAYVNRATERREVAKVTQNEKLRKKDRDGALADYTKAVSLNGGDAPTFYNRGVAKFENGDIAGAIEDYLAANRLDDKDARVLYDLGVAYEKQHQWEDAMVKYRAAIQIKSDYPQASFNLAGIEYDQAHDLAQYQEAANAYSEALRSNDKWVEALHGLGLAHVKMGEHEKKPEDADKALRDYEQAANDFTRALALAPGDKVLYYDLGVARLRENHSLEALEAFNTAGTGGLDTPELYFNRGLARQQSADNDQAKQAALADYDKAIEKKPDYADAWRQRGEAHCDLGHWDAALTDLEKASSLKPNQAGVYDAMGRAYYGKGVQDKTYFAKASEAYGHEIEITPTAEAYQNKGVAQYKSGDIKGAVESFNQSIQLNRSAQAYCNLRTAYLGLQDWKKADEMQQTAISIAPQDAKMYCLGDVHLSPTYINARKDYDSGDLARAEQEYREATVADPSNPDAHYGLGVVLYRKTPRDNPGAISEFTAVLNSAGIKDRLRADAYYGRAVAYHSAGEIEKAAGDFQKALDSRPDFADALIGLAEVRTEQEQWPEAAANFKKGIALKTSKGEEVSWKTWEGSGIARYKTNDPDGAFEDFKQATSKNPSSIEGFIGLGDAYAKKRQWSDALAAYEKAHDNFNAANTVTPGNKATLAGILLDRGSAHYELGQLAAARDDYNKAIRLNPKNEPGYYDRGNLYLKQMSLKTSLIDSRRATTLSPQDADAFDIRGIAHADQGSLRPALAAFNEALKRKPNDPDLLFNRANVEVALNDFTSALADYDNVIAQRPNDIEAYYRKGIALAAKGDSAGAETVYKDVAAKSPEFASRAYASLSDLYRSMGETEKAKDAYAKAGELGGADSKKVNR